MIIEWVCMLGGPFVYGKHQSIVTLAILVFYANAAKTKRIHNVMQKRTNVKMCAYENMHIAN